MASSACGPQRSGTPNMCDVLTSCGMAYVQPWKISLLETQTRPFLENSAGTSEKEWKASLLLHPPKLGLERLRRNRERDLKTRQIVPSSRCPHLCELKAPHHKIRLPGAPGRHHVWWNMSGGTTRWCHRSPCDPGSAGVSYSVYRQTIFNKAYLILTECNWPFGFTFNQVCIQYHTIGVLSPAWSTLSTGHPGYPVVSSSASDEFLHFLVSISEVPSAVYTLQRSFCVTILEIGGPYHLVSIPFYGLSGVTEGSASFTVVELLLN